MIFELLQLFLFFFIIKEIQILKNMICKNNLLKTNKSNDLFDNGFLNDFTNNFQKIFKNLENDFLKEPIPRLSSQKELVD